MYYLLVLQSIIEELTVNETKYMEVHMHRYIVFAISIMLNTLLF